MNRRPERKPIDHRYQDEIDQSWDSKLKEGDLCWVFHSVRGKIYGPYNFSYYTPLGAVAWGQSSGRNFGVKIRYSRGEVVCGSESLATQRLFVHKLIQASRLKVELGSVEKEVAELIEKLKGCQ